MYERGVLRAGWAAMVLLVAAGGVSGQGPMPLAAVSVRVAGEESISSPLVPCDPDMVDWLQQARQAVRKKQYDRAVEILSALLEKPDAGFVPDPKDARRFSPLRQAAVGLMGEIPPEGLVRYRRRNDLKAEKRLREALEKGDWRALKSVAEQYRRTCVGPAAVEALGDRQWDRGWFAQAGRTWKNLLSEAAPCRVPMLLFKAAVAFHLAGDEEQAQGLAKRLRETFPDARSPLSGRERNLAEAIEEYLAIPAPKPAQAVLRDGYPGWGGLPGGRAVMPDSRAVLWPVWRYPSPDAAEGASAASLAEELFVAWAGGLEWRDGHLWRQLRIEDRSVGQFLPPVIHPVAVGKVILYRDDWRVVALDARTGRCRWKSQPLPLWASDDRSMVNSQAMQMLWQQRMLLSPMDMGRHALTVGGGRVYTVYHFRLPLPSHWVSIQPNRMASSSTSRLAALSLRGEGKIEWILGEKNGGGTEEEKFLNTCTFLSPPLYLSDSAGDDDGRLYVSAVQGEMFYLLCLRAADGRLIWKSPISQTPVLPAFQGVGMNGWLAFPSLPPAAGEGVVFAATQQGVLAAFDAYTGQPIWAYQYPSTASGGVPPYLVRPVLRGGRGEIRLPPAPTASPILVSRGRVIFAPADGQEVLAFSAWDGEVLWRCPRGGYSWLVALDDDRLVLAGKGLAILDVRNGKMIRQIGGVQCLAAPVAVEGGLLVSGRGRLWRVEGKNYAVSSEPLLADGLLGNLVSRDDGLLAANAMGLCLYGDYERTLAVLTKRMKGKPPPGRLPLLMQRGDLSFHAGRYVAALRDYTEAAELAQSFSDGEETRYGRAQLRQNLYRVHVALGNAEKDAGRSLDHFVHAAALAVTDRQRAQMLLRIARRQEQAGRFADAAATAQRLYEQYAAEEVVDVPVGPDVDGRKRFGENEPTISARLWATRFLQRLLQIHGQAAYAAFDAQAERALREARCGNRTPEAFLKICRRWPWSRFAAEAQFAAAEEFYRRARQATRKGEKNEALRRCEDLLEPLTRMSGCPYRSSALAALAMVRLEAGRLASVALAKREMAKLPPDTLVVFAGWRAPLRNVLADLEKGGSLASPVGAPGRSLSTLRLPLRPIFTVGGPAARLLFDGSARPIRIGSLLFLRNSEGTFALDPSVDSPVQAMRGPALTTLALVPPHPLAAGRAGKSVAVADQQGVSVFDAETFKLLRQESWAEQGAASVLRVGFPDGLMIFQTADGSLTARDCLTGEIRWQSAVSAPFRSPFPPHPNPMPMPVVLPGGAPVLPIPLRTADGGREQGFFSWEGIDLPVRNGCVATVEISGDSMVVVRNVRNGKKLFSRVVARSSRTPASFPPSEIHIEWAGDALLAVAAGGNVFLFDLREPEAPVLETKSAVSPAGVSPLLGGDRDFLAVRGEKGTVRLFSARSPDRPPVILKSELPDGETGLLPMEAFSDGENVYVFSCSSPEIPVPRAWARLAVRRFVISAYDPMTGAARWREETASVGGGASLYSWAMTREHLIVTLWRQDNAGGTCLLLDKASGKVMQHLPLPGGTDRLAPLYPRRMAIAGGRLVVETGKGVVVYGE